MVKISEPYKRQLSQIDSLPGIDVVASLLIMAEISNEPMRSFESAEKLCSWAGLVPRNDQSAGKIYSKKVLPGNKYLKSILCQCAWVAVKQRGNLFHKWYWTHQRKMGEKKAITAVSRKILTVIYKLLSTVSFYDPQIAMAHLQ